MFGDFTRSDLRHIRERAEERAATCPNRHWMRAYWRLASAADGLDAMKARSEEKEQEIKLAPEPEHSVDDR